jgi:hypothetical protein
MDLVNHYETPKLWAMVHKKALKEKMMSFWSCLSNMY